MTSDSFRARLRAPCGDGYRATGDERCSTAERNCWTTFWRCSGSARPRLSHAADAAASETPAAPAEAEPEAAPADEPVKTQTEGPTQRMATNTIATTVAQTVVETNDHVVEEHSVIVTTQTEEK